MKVLVEDVAFRYRREPVLSSVSLEMPAGALTAVVGPASCGKSTLLGLIAGLLRPKRGKVVFDGEDVTGLPAERRDDGVIFPTYALFPHLTVRENIAFGLRAGRRRSRHTRRSRVGRHARTCRGVGRRARHGTAAWRRLPGRRAHPVR